MNEPSGKVFLVGAGPGDPGLLTLRALTALSAAEVVVYDRLAFQDIGEIAPEGAELIYAGKTPDRHTLTQDEINALLVEKGRLGKTVVRLKGGDPFVFGRGGEEAEALQAAGIPFEVVPGISSAIAVPAYAGIPVTHRGLTCALGIITGHEDPTKPQSALRWEHLARGLDTLVFLMGVKNLPEIASRLMEHGRLGETPVAVIQWGTRPEQRTVTGTLRDIAQTVQEAGITSPAVTVVGDVVRLREKLRWFDTRPLFGVRVLVTRSREQASGLTARLEDLGAAVTEFPVISCQALQDTQALQDAIARLPEFQWAVFTSANGVRFFLDNLWEMGLDVRALAGLKLAALGQGTRAALEDRGLRVDFTPSRFVGEAFAEEFPDARPGVRVLIARAAQAREVIPEELSRRGVDVEVIPCYQTVEPDQGMGEDLRALLEEGKLDVVTFTSSSTVRNFVRMVWGGGPAALPEGVKVASIGPVTSQTARELGLPVHVEAGEHSIPGLVQAVLGLMG